ncbi:MAG: hypothetical protein J5803_00155, partial [Desulfovibrio sp.]|nr:hypothetical protein [Desulfovibrio sp.]
MKRYVQFFVLCALLVFCSTQTRAADARQEAFLKAAQDFVVDHKLPDGETIEKEDILEDFANNDLAICDVDGDGKPELLVQFKGGTMASLLEYVCGFDEGTGKLTVKFAGTPDMEFYSNGCLKEKVS